MKWRSKIVVILIFCQKAFADFTTLDNAPSRSLNLLSTNWIAAVKEAIPSAPMTLQTSFQITTNLLRQESERGNSAAEGLWGFLLVYQSHSPEETTSGLELMRKSASSGFVPAMLNLGDLLVGGEYVEKNFEEAFHWFRKASENKNADGFIKLAMCYQRGLGTSRDASKVVECYRQAASLTNYVAMKSLGYLLMNGIGAEKDVEAAKRWFTRSAKEGNNARAMCDLGVVAMSALDKDSMREAFEWFKQSAALGDPLASFELVNYYSTGLGGIETNVETARFWRLRAATLGSTEAEYKMGDAYEEGDGVPKNIEIALEWYRKAAAKNYPPAFYDLARLHFADKTNRLSRLQNENYMLQAAQMGHREAQFLCAMNCFRGDAGALDCEDGRNWLEMAAKNGWPRAEFLLFQLYYNGARPISTCQPYPKDVPKAIEWLRRSAEHGSFEAKSLLAIFLIKGVDVNADKAEAEKMLRYCAEHGHASAQNDLGFAILNGDTEKKDLVEAAMWCQLAKSQKADTNLFRRAEANLSRILASLTPNQKLEVDERVNDFRVLPVAKLDPMIKDWDRNPIYSEEGRSELH